MQVIDGSHGEGGGQVLRTSLGLSLVTQTPVRVENVRAGRRKPGLLRQHLTALRAAVAIGDAEVEGDRLGSRAVVFRPRRVRPGEYHFAVGTAGSASLVLQTVLPALLVADGPSRLVLEGGTDNPAAPPFDFLAASFAPLVTRLGAELELVLDRRGFYPAGGGRFVCRVSPARLEGFSLLEAGPVRSVVARARVAGLPRSIAERERQVLIERLGLGPGDGIAEEMPRAWGPGNVVSVTVERAHATHVVTAFGEKGKAAEKVAHQAAGETLRLLASDAPVCEHLADQLMLLLGLAGDGVFRTVRPTRHTTTQVDTMRAFLDVPIRIVDDGAGHRVEVGRG